MESIEFNQQILNWLKAGKKVTVATVIWKQGSALRGVGSKMAVNSDMEISGSVSGGCVEGAVVEEAFNVMSTDKITIVDYGVADETAWSVGLACGGKIKILLQPVESNRSFGLTNKMLLKILELKSSNRPFCMLTVFSGDLSGESGIISEGELIYPNKEPIWLNDGLKQEITALERSETSGIIKLDSSDIFADFTFPKPRLVIIGAVHIAIPLVEMARICGFTTIIIDPRKTFATPKRFPYVDDLVIDWPADGLEKIGLNNRDFLLALSHDDKLDLPALRFSLDRNVHYIGMLSSRQTRDVRFTQLVEQGIKKEDLKRIHAPIGLDIGARTPEEIAISILAEITAFRYEKS
jgi:xanthine dehydrogenase accessory factor